ncbi:MAG TPA: hypothetical protein VFG11_03695, partial [Acidobacteriota bacterium]|nr:hypothetical protein [Acidobacteriota bacterium]
LAAQQYENSIGQFRKTLDMYPEDTTSLNLLMDVLIQTNQYLEAVSEYEKSSRRQNDTKALATAEELRRAYQDSGPSGFWKKALVHAEEEYQSGRRSEYELAAVCVRAGDTDRAFELLKKSYEKKDADFCMLKMDPRFDPVRTDPRFSELVKLLKMS